MQSETLAITKTQERVNSYVASVYGWMTLGLFVTALSGVVALSSRSFVLYVLFNRFAFFGIIIAELLLVVYLSTRIAKISLSQARAVFLIYSALNGITLGIILLAFTGASVVSTFMIAAGTFGVMAIYGYSAKRDLTSLGSLAMMGLWGIILASIVNLFLKNDAAQWVVTYLGIAVFVGLTAYDSQKIREIAQSGAHDEAALKKLSILGALTLYLDLINLFLLLLRIFGKRK